MTNPNQQPFTRDIYPGLDEALDASFVSAGPSVAEIPRDGLVDSVNAAVVGAEGVSDEILDWVHARLPDSFAMLKSCGVPNLPDTIESLGDEQPQLVKKSVALYARWNQLKNMGELQTPAGNHPADTMKLIIMPWQDMRDNLHRVDSWLVERLQHSDPGVRDDVIEMVVIKEVIESEIPMYHHPEFDDKYISAEDYLDYKLNADGPFGLLLAQPFDDAGLNGREISMMPSDLLILAQQKHIKMGEVAVDAMGIFEWLALTLQYDSDIVDHPLKYILLANQFHLDLRLNGLSAKADNGKLYIRKHGLSVIPVLHAKGFRPHLAIQ